MISRYKSYFFVAIVSIFFLCSFWVIRVEYEKSPEYIGERLARISIEQGIYRQSILRQKNEIEGVKREHARFNKRVPWYHLDLPHTYLYSEVVRDAELKLARTYNEKAKLLRIGFLVGTPYYEELITR